MPISNDKSDLVSVKSGQKLQTFPEEQIIYQMTWLVREGYRVWYTPCGMDNLGIVARIE